jgi:metal-responsive CopG/Arc/MetJ family transcriptional regulator
MVSQDKKIPKKRGRPATGTSPTIGVRMPADLTDAVDSWRAGQRPIPSRPEAIRQLVEQALKRR